MMKRWTFAMLLCLSASAYATEQSRGECVKNALSKLIHGVVAFPKEYPKKKKKEFLQFAREFKEQGPIRLVIARDEDPPFGLDLRHRPILRKAYWIFEPVYAASGYQKKLASPAAITVGTAATIALDLATENSSLNTFLAAAPLFPGDTYSEDILESDEYSSYEIKDRAFTNHNAIREWIQSHKSKDQSQSAMLPRIKEMLSRGTLRSKDEAKALDLLAYRAYTLAVQEILEARKSDPKHAEELKKASGRLIEQKYYQLLLSDPQFKNRSEHDVLLLTMLFTPRFEIQGISDLDTYDWLLETNTHQSARISNTTRDRLNKNHPNPAAFANLASPLRPGELLSVYALSLSSKDELLKKKQEAGFLPPNKRYLADRVDFSKWSGELTFLDGPGQKQKFSNELSRWKYLMTADTLADLKDAWLKNEISDASALKTMNQIIEGMNLFYRRLEMGDQPTQKHLCELIKGTPKAYNPLFSTPVNYINQVAKTKKLSDEDRSHCLQEVASANWEYWARRLTPDGPRLLNHFNALLERCPENKSAPVWDCMKEVD